MKVWVQQEMTVVSQSINNMEVELLQNCACIPEAKIIPEF